MTNKFVNFEVLKLNSYCIWFLKTFKRWRIGNTSRIKNNTGKLDNLPSYFKEFIITDERIK